MIASTTPTLEFLNSASAAQFSATLEGIYEHSPWIAQQAAAMRPFATFAALKIALHKVVSDAGSEAQLGLIRAHPELAGKAAIAGQLTAESTGEQAAAGLHLCSAEEFACLHQLNADYNVRFGFPFIVAVKGPAGRGLTRAQIIATFQRRLAHQPAAELAENLRQIGRIAELRLNALLGVEPSLGNLVLAGCETLSAWSDDEQGLTCAYLTVAHQKVAAQLCAWMSEAGMEVELDALGNVVGTYRGSDQDAQTLVPPKMRKTLITGSHYDTVCNGGKYDGRAGILVPIAVVQYLHARGERLPFDLQVVGFCDEEGVRYNSTFLGSSALAGRFDPALLARKDSADLSMQSALEKAGHKPAEIAALVRDPAHLLGFVELHIEQGPVLLERDLPVGVVQSIAGSCRYLLRLTGVASHAGTTPMSMRQDAAAAAAEIVLLVERRCGTAPSLVGTVGQLQVPNGSINVIPGLCELSLDIRAADDLTRDAAVADIVQGIAAICARRQIACHSELVLKAAAVPCAPRLMQQLASACERAGVAAFHLPSGAGHDAMAMAALGEVGMLFIRCGNGGISHNPLETMSADDAELAAQIFLDFLRHFSDAAAAE